MGFMCSMLLVSFLFNSCYLSYCCHCYWMTYSFVEIGPFVGQIGCTLLCFTVVVHVVQPINDNIQFHER